MKNFIKIICILLSVSVNANAQERSSSYTNLLNPFIYNPALAGGNNSVNAIFNSKGIAGGIDGAARSYNFALHAPLKTDMGIGAKILSSSIGAFQTLNVEGAFRKSVKLTEKGVLGFGVSLGMAQTNLKQELLNPIVDVTDASLNSQNLNKMLFTAGAGLLYKYDKKAELGISMPAIVTADQPFGNIVVANAAWNFYTGAENIWRIKPMLNYYHLNISPSMVDVLAQGSWKETVSLTSGYRSNGSFIAAIGLNVKSLSVGYAYYSHFTGYSALAPTQNEISVAFTFNRPKASSRKNNDANNDEAIQDEIDQITTKLNTLTEMEKTNPELVDMKKGVSKLNRDLEKVLTKYKITNPNQLQKIKNLQATLEPLMLKYND